MDLKGILPVRIIQWLLAGLLAIVVALLILLLLGRQVTVGPYPIQIRRNDAPAVFATPKRLDNDKLFNGDQPFTAPCDGFIYVECRGEMQSCEVLVPGSRFLTSGTLSPNNSAMFPIQKGQTVKMTKRNPSEGDAFVYFYAFAFQSNSP